MLNFISSETVMVVSFVCKNMPNLFKYIVKCSTPSEKKVLPEPSTTMLAPEQIEAARKHPSTIALQALNTVAAIQNAINTTNAKIEELVKQRTIIENALVTLLSLDNQG